MAPEDFIFVDKYGDVFMPDIVMTLQIIIALARSKGYEAIKYADWLRRNDAPQHVSTPAQLRANANCGASSSPLRRRSPSARGSPRSRSPGKRGVNGGVARGLKKLRLQRIPRHRFTRSEILDMVKVPGAPVVGMSMMGRCGPSELPSAEVRFASPGDCEKVYGEVKEPLERDGIQVSQA